MIFACHESTCGESHRAPVQRAARQVCAAASTEYVDPDPQFRIEKVHCKYLSF